MLFFFFFLFSPYNVRYVCEFSLLVLILFFSSQNRNQISLLKNGFQFRLMLRESARVFQYIVCLCCHRCCGFICVLVILAGFHWPMPELRMLLSLFHSFVKRSLFSFWPQSVSLSNSETFCFGTLVA